MTHQASQMSLESLEDCWSDSEVPPVTTCCPMVRSAAPRRGPSYFDLQFDDSSDVVSLQSCNSTETLKQWTMRKSVTPCCCSVSHCCCSSCSKRRGRRERRESRPDDEDRSDDDSSSETDVVIEYPDGSSEVVCYQQSPCCPRKKCTLV